MKDLIRCIKLMRYALQLKMILILTVLFFILGIAFEMTDFGTPGTISIGALYLALCGMYFYQLVFTPTVSKMIQTSPLKKKLQTSGPIIVSFSASMIFLTIYIIIRCIRITPDFLVENNLTSAKAYSAILFAGFCSCIFLIYLSFSYKSFIFSLVLVFGSLAVLLYFGGTDMIQDISTKLLVGESPVLIIITSYGLTIAGSVIGYFLSLLFYKNDISELAVRYALRQAQK